MRLWGKGVRLIGWVLFFGGVITLALDAWGWWRNDFWETTNFGGAWAAINANSLVGLGSFVENKISPWLWVEIIVPILVQPLWLVSGLPGIVLIYLTRRRRRGIFFD